MRLNTKKNHNKNKRLIAACGFILRLFCLKNIRQYQYAIPAAIRPFAFAVSG